MFYKLAKPEKKKNGTANMVQKINIQTL